MKIIAELGEIRVEADVPDETTPEAVNRLNRAAESMVATKWIEMHNPHFMTKATKDLLVTIWGSKKIKSDLAQ